MQLRIKHRLSELDSIAVSIAAARLVRLAHEVVGPDRGAPIPDEDKTKIYQTNAERVFKLGAA